MKDLLITIIKFFGTSDIFDVSNSYCFLKFFRSDIPKEYIRTVIVKAALATSGSATSAQVHTFPIYIFAPSIRGIVIFKTFHYYPATPLKQTKTWKPTTMIRRAWIYNIWLTKPPLTWGTDRYCAVVLGDLLCGSFGWHITKKLMALVPRWGFKIHSLK